MKKRILAILLALVLCFTFAALAACKPTQEGDGDGEGEGGNGGGESSTLPENLPTQEGKVTFVVEVDYDLPNGVSPFLTGSIFTNWGNGLEMKKFEQTKFFYVLVDDFSDQIPEWEGNETDVYNGYKIVLGFNSESGYGENKQGNQGRWIEADQYLGPNGEFEWKEGQNIVNLGKATWESKGGMIGAPYRISEVTVRVVIATALGENAKVVIVGDWDNGVEHVATREDYEPTGEGKEDYSIWSAKLGDIMDTNYGYNVVITKDTTADEPEVITVINSHNEDNKLFVEFNETDDGFIVDLAGTNGWEDEDVELVGLDLADAVGGNLDVYKPVEITITVQFASAIPAGYTVWLNGGGDLFTGWGSGLKFEANGDRTVWTLKLAIDENLLGKTSEEFKICVVEGDTFNWSGTNFGLKDGVISTDGDAGNMSGFVFAMEVELFKGEKLVFAA